MDGYFCSSCMGDHNPSAKLCEMLLMCVNKIVIMEELVQIKRVTLNCLNCSRPEVEVV